MRPMPGWCPRRSRAILAIAPVAEGGSSVSETPTALALERPVHRYAWWLLLRPGCAGQLGVRALLGAPEPLAFSVAARGRRAFSSPPPPTHRQWLERPGGRGYG